VVVVLGWEVSIRQTTAPLVLTDLTPLTKVQVRAAWDGQMARALGVGFGRAVRGVPQERAATDGGSRVTAGGNSLLVGSGPGEWLLLAEPVTAARQVEHLQRLAGHAAHGELVTVTDLTHGRALIRLTGAASPELLARLCGIDLADEVTPNRAAFRAPVARLATDVVRDDQPSGTRSYLLHCERSSGRYLWDALLDAGADLGIDVGGFTLPGI
jgi:sarcosine oxidase, subunit gamma